MRYEVSQEPKDVEPGDIAVMRLVTTKGAVKWTCGTVRGAGVRACDRCHVQCPSRHVD